MKRDDAGFAVLGTVQAALIAAITVVAVPLPAIGREFGIGPGELALISAGYGLAFGGLLLVGGRFGDRWGRRRALLIGLAGFVLASLASAVSPSPIALLCARFAQGAAAAVTAPAALALVGSVYPDPARRGRALAVWGGLAGLGATAGNLASGLVATWASWRWALVLPGLVAAAVGALGSRVVPTGPVPVRTPVPVLGAVCATVALTSFGYALLGTGGFGLASSLAVGAGALASLGFVVVQRTGRTPLVPRGLVAGGRRIGALAVIITTAAGMTITFFLLSLYFQQVRGFSAIGTSLAFLPFGLAQVLAWSQSGRLVRRFGPWRMLLAGLGLVVVGLLVLTRLGVATSYVGAPLVALLVLPVGMSSAFAGAMPAAIDRAPAATAGVLAAVANTAMEIGPSIGLATFANLAARRATQLTASPPAAAMAAGDRLAFLAAAGATGVVLVLVATIHSRSDNTTTEREMR